MASRLRVPGEVGPEAGVKPRRMMSGYRDPELESVTYLDALSLVLETDQRMPRNFDLMICLWLDKKSISDNYRKKAGNK